MPREFSEIVRAGVIPAQAPDACTCGVGALSANRPRLASPLGCIGCGIVTNTVYGHAIRDSCGPLPPAWYADPQLE